jgi:hypothetical protein
LKAGEAAQAKFKAFPMQKLANADEAKRIALPHCETTESDDFISRQAHR